jgi:hypothetical protein
VLDPISPTPMLRSRVLPTVLGAIVLHHVCGVGLLEKLGRTFRFDRATRKHGNSRRAVVDALGENFGEVLLILAPQ